ncbi:MAG: type I restriction endonuclease, partial [Bacilli bacterium]
MMQSSPKISENKIEEFTIKLLENLGYEYFYGPDIAHDSLNPQRASFSEVILPDKVKSAIQRINRLLPPSTYESAFKELLRINAPELVANNESFHRMLTEGIKVTYQKDDHERGDLIWLIDFEHPDNNEFLVVNQFTVIENNVNKRPDVVLFVNGLPLVVMELKNAADENATIHSAYRQVQTYKDVIPSLFTYNGFLVISDGLEARAGTISSGITRFMAWKSSDGKTMASDLVGQLETLIKGMLNKQTLLDLIRHFIVFESTKHEDLDTDIVTI